jgi:uncharacterized protein (UPF0332 family)
MPKLEELIKSGKVLTIDLPAKRKELFSNQLSLLKDDLDNLNTLFAKGKYRGAFIHAFNALERAIDMFLALKGIKVRDRFSRGIAIEEKLSEEFLGEFEDLYDMRRNGMYERGLISKELVLGITEDKLPFMIRKINEALPEKERINLEDLLS